MMGWQPIETAPNDGTPFLGAWQLRNLDEWIIQSCSRFDGKCRLTWDHDDQIRPTHWVPLPDPPK